MLEQIIDCLIEDEFTNLQTNREEFGICFKLENHFINAVHVVDCAGFPNLLAEDFKKMVEPIRWQFEDGKNAEVHMFTLVLTNEVDRYREQVKENPFCWFIDVDSKTLIIDEDKAPDFYGLKGKLIESLKNPYQKKEEPKQPIEETSQKKTFFKTTWVNTSLIVVNSILFVFCFFLGGTIFDLGMLDLPSVMKDGEWYRLISSMFLHSDITHLTSNMLLLFVLGELVENELGHAKYLALYFGAGLGGDLFSLIFEYITKNYTGSIGASGAIFGVAGAFLWILIRNYGRMNNISAVQIIFLISYSLYSGFRSTNVDNAAHVGGVLTGFILCIFLYHKKQKSKNEKASVKAASE